MVTISCVGLVVRGRFEQFFHIGDVLTASEAEPRPVKILTRSAIALIGAALISGQAVGANFGTLTLKASEIQTVDIGATGRNMRVCNDFFSSGPVVVTIGGNLPHDLSPGVCAEDIGDRLTVQSHASGLATVEFRPLNDVGIFSK
jgi:zinc transporter ZupT